DRASHGLASLQGQAENLASAAAQQPGLSGLFSSFRANTPQLYVDIDRTKVKTMGIELSDVFNTLQVALGGFYVNDFNRFGRTWQVNLQADASFRPRPRMSASSRSGTPRARWCPWARWPMWKISAVQ